MDKKRGKFIGAHLPAAGGVDRVPNYAREIGATAFALFVKPQRQWLASPLKKETIEAFRNQLRVAGIDASQVLPHASYLINMATPDEEARNRSIKSLEGEMGRCRELGLKSLNIHPGSYVRVGTPEEGCKRISDTINRVFLHEAEGKIVLENTAGQGSYLGARFEELAMIIERVDDEARVGVCLDTAHLYGAGFNIATEEGWQRMLEDFDRIIGFERLCGVHLNDTKVERGSHLDRHAVIGAGQLGWETFARIMRDDRFDGIPLILETPEPSVWAEEIRRLKAL